MPGLFSTVFDDRGDHASNDHATQRWDGDGSHGSESGTSSDTHAAAHADPTIHIHDEVSASWENPDGSESSWSNTQDVTLTVDLHAAAEAGTNFDQSNFDG
jgi:hypothetical protein